MLETDEEWVRRKSREAERIGVLALFLCGGSAPVGQARIARADDVIRASQAAVSGDVNGTIFGNPFGPEYYPSPTAV